MNPKIIKIRRELDKKRARIAEWQADCREMEKQLRELENLDIVGLVRERGFTLEQFIELMKAVPTVAKQTQSTNEQEEPDPYEEE